MTICFVHDHVRNERITTNFKVDALYGCETVMDDPENPILQACVKNNWIEDGSTWSTISNVDLMKIISRAFLFRDEHYSAEDTPDDKDHFMDLIMMLMSMACAKMTLQTDFTVDSMTVVRGSGEFVTVNFTVGDMYSFGERSTVPADFLKVVVDNSNESNN